MHLAFFPHGSIGVEFFFVLSGFLMAKSIFRRRASAASPNEYLGFLAHKYTAIFPQHFVAFVIAVWVYKDIKLRDVPKVLLSSAAMSAML